MFLLVLFSVLLSILVKADRILIDEPPSGGIFRHGALMDIRYKVRFEGMAKLHFASVSLSNADTKEVVSFFPSADWSDAHNDNRTAHATWKIPETLKSGTYSLRVAGPASYACSRNRDGRPPYDRCSMVIEKSVSFIVGGTPTMQ